MGEWSASVTEMLSNEDTKYIEKITGKNIEDIINE
jgi:hypothetical protein